MITAGLPTQGYICRGRETLNDKYGNIYPGPVGVLGEQLPSTESTARQSIADAVANKVDIVEPARLCERVL